MNNAHLHLEDAPRKHSLARARLRCSLQLHLQHICNNLFLQQSLCNVFASYVAKFFLQNISTIYLLHSYLQQISAIYLKHICNNIIATGLQ